jgi:hypothetical protein
VVKIADRYETRVAACNDGFRRLKRSIAISQQKANAAAAGDESIGSHNVENSVSVNVREYGHGSAWNGVTDRIQEVGDLRGGNKHLPRRNN